MNRRTHVPVTLGESEQARGRHPEKEKGQPVDYRVLQDDARCDRQCGGIAQALEEHRAEKSRGPERRGESQIVQEEPDGDRGGARETDQNSLVEYRSRPMIIYSCLRVFVGPTRPSPDVAPLRGSIK